MKKTKTITIDRSKWRCGGSDKFKKLGSTKMINEYGLMCCLGQVCNQAGVSKESMNACDYPEDVNHKRIPKYLIEESGNNKFTWKAIRINDDNKISQSKREAKLIEHFKKINIDLKFTGKLPKKLQLTQEEK